MSLEDWRDKNFEQVERNFEDDSSRDVPHIEEDHRQVSEHSWDEEFSADITYNDTRNEVRLDEGENRNEQSFQIMGWLAVILSLVSFFILPIIMAIGGIVLGVISRNKRARTLGSTAIVISIVSFIYFLFLRPMFF